MEIKDIIITKRIRKDLGDLNPLTKSIQEIGLLHPIVINEKKELICGRRRLQVLKNIGIKDLIEGSHYRIINISDMLKGEFEENFCRKDFTPSEAVEIWKAADSHQGKLQSESDRSQRRNKISKSLGVGKTWLSEAKAVVDSGRKDLIEQMDTKMKSVHEAYEEIKKSRIPDPVYVNFETYDKIKKGTKTQVSKRFGNWILGDTVELRIASAGSLDILSVLVKSLKEYTNEDAVNEGFKDLKDMKAHWKKENLEWEENQKMIVLKIRAK